MIVQTFQILSPGLNMAVALLLVYSASHDLGFRTVPNWTSCVILVLSGLVRWLDHSLLAGLAVSVSTFAVLYVAWLLGGMGGGDVKLWAAAALFISPEWQPELAFFLHVVLLGGVLGLFYLLLRLVVPIMSPRPRPERPAGFLSRVLRAEAWRIRRHAPLPYACAIAGGALLACFPSSLSFQL